MFNATEMLVSGVAICFGNFNFELHEQQGKSNQDLIEHFIS